MEQLSISLLSHFQVNLGGDPITEFATDKARALLAYLAVEADRPHSRDTLSGLLWPEQPQRKARHNLRQALSHLRQAIQDQDKETPFLLVSRQAVQFNRESEHWLDVAAFINLVEACRTHRHRRLETCLSCMQRLEQAAALYRGGFLQQFFLQDSALFEEWALLKREWLHRQAVEGLSCLAAYHERRRDYALARQYVWRLVELDPWREEAHRQLMRLLALDGQRSAALAQYETCCRMLEQELGVPPTAETVALYERIRDGKPEGRVGQAVAAVLPWAVARLDNLPPSPTPLVGRQEELAELADWLVDPDCRLLSLVGPGGIGKTRLALRAAADQVGAFAHGVYFVSLAALSSSERIVPQIADALALSLYGQQATEAQLLNYLRDKEMLLVLDSMEHVLKGGDLLAQILRRAPGVLILVTSRERLNLQEEWVYQVEGLCYPRLAPDSPGEQLDVLAGCDAVSLFQQSARRTSRRFALTEATAPHVVRICQMVAGMPLGIELAAAGVSVRSVEEIAQEIARNLDVLSTTWRNVPERHRSMRATLAYSWSLLTEQERHLFVKLSAFVGGFEREAAEQVAGATPELLQSLVYKSFLPGSAKSERKDAARFQIHPLLQQYGAEKLADDPQMQAVVQARHCAYYVDLVKSYQAELAGSDPALALAAMKKELENVKAAWRCAMARDDFAALERGLLGLSHFYLLRGPFQDGSDLIQGAVDRVRRRVESGTSPPVPPALACGASVTCTSVRRKWPAGSVEHLQVTLVKLLVEQARLLNAQAFYPQAVSTAQEAIGWISGCQSWQTSAGNQGEGLEDVCVVTGLEATAHLIWGQALRLQGNYPSACAQLEQALMLAREASMRDVEAEGLRTLGHTGYQRGDLDEAEGYYRQALSIYEQLGDRKGEGAVLNGFGNVLYRRGNHAEAQLYLEQALEIYRERNDLWGESKLLNNLGNCCAVLGDYTVAETYYERALDINRTVGNRRGESIALNNLAALYWSEGDYARAWACYERALRICCDIGDRQGEAEALSNLSLLAYLRGDDTAALDYGQRALSLSRELGDRPNQAYALTRLGMVYTAQGRFSQAAAAYRRALALRLELGCPHIVMETRAGLARLHVLQDDLDQAQAQVEEILSHLQAHTLDGTDEPFRIYLTCYQVLRANQDPRAAEVLSTAYCLLQAQAAKIKMGRRRSFLEDVGVHREIVATFTQAR